MTAYDILDEIIANGYVCTNERINEYFTLVSSSELIDQIALELIPNEYGTEYTTIDGMIIRIED